MTRNEDFAMAIAKSHMMEAFIVGSMVHTARQAVLQPNEIPYIRLFRRLNVVRQKPWLVRRI